MSRKANKGYDLSASSASSASKKLIMTPSYGGYRAAWLTLICLLVGQSDDICG